MASSIATALASTVASKAIGSLMGGKKGSGGSGDGGAIQFPDFYGGGIRTYMHPELGIRSGYYGEEGQKRLDAVNSVKSSLVSSAGDIRSNIPKFNSAFEGYIDELNNVLGEVNPGFGKLTKSRVDAIQNQRQKTISDVSNDFSRRGILGSSIAQGTISSIDSEFSRQEADARAQSFLEELDVKTQLLAERTNTDVTRLQTAMDQTLLASQYEREADTFQIEEWDKHLSAALQAMGVMASISSQNANLAQNLAIKNAEGNGAFAGLIGQGIGKAVGNFDFSSLFG